MAGTQRSARDQALHWLEYRDRTRGELRKHLCEKGYPEEEVRDALDFAEEYGFVDDKAYCQKYIEYCADRSRGSMRIRHDLENKGVGRETIDLAMEAGFDRDRERELAMGEAQKELAACLARQRSNDTGALGGTAGETGGVSGDEDAMIPESELVSGRKPAIDKKDWDRIARKLASRGFPAAVIGDTLSRLRR